MAAPVSRNYFRPLPARPRGAALQPVPGDCRGARCSASRRQGRPPGRPSRAAGPFLTPERQKTYNIFVQEFQSNDISKLQIRGTPRAGCARQPP